MPLSLVLYHDGLEEGIRDDDIAVSYSSVAVAADDWTGYDIDLAVSAGPCAAFLFQGIPHAR